MTESDGWSRHELLVMDKLDRLTLGQDELRRDVSGIKSDLAGLKERVNRRATLVAAIVALLTVVAAAIARAL
jgi:hypothetical protein